MQEHTISIGLRTYNLDEPFMVLATQNPIEMEGTYVLPEAQLDRFMFCVKVKYPNEQDEIAIVRGTTGASQPKIEKVIGKEDIKRLQSIVRNVPVSDEVIRYAVRLVASTRVENGSTSEIELVRKYVGHGASPRASQYLILGAKAKALLNGRYHVSKADVDEVSHAVLRHRLVLNFRSKADKVNADHIISEILSKLKQP